MCGIVACRSGDAAVPYLLEGLGRLEYRGYDSAGIAVVNPRQQRLTTVRAVGPLTALRGRMAELASAMGGLGIGHTRWATHGAVTEENAHPHLDCAGQVAVVHNGIIENST